MTVCKTQVLGKKVLGGDLTVPHGAEAPRRALLLCEKAPTQLNQGTDYLRALGLGLPRSRSYHKRIFNWVRWWVGRRFQARAKGALEGAPVCADAVDIDQKAQVVLGNPVGLDLYRRILKADDAKGGVSNVAFTVHGTALVLSLGMGAGPLWRQDSEYGLLGLASLTSRRANAGINCGEIESCRA